jgi:1,4-alpha-glucan branching enzyme
MYGQPGKKLLFMGAEVGARDEWNHEREVPWGLLDDPGHAGVARWLADLNRCYRARSALHELDCDPGGFQWVEANAADDSILAWLRHDRNGRAVLVVANYTPVTRPNIRIGVDREGSWNELLNSDASVYGGSGVGNLGRVETAPIPFHGRPLSIVLTLPPLGVLFLEWSPSDDG